MATNTLRTISHNIEIGRISSEVSKLTPKLDQLQIEDRLTKLFSRIETIRQLNFWSQINLEADQIKAAELWASIEPSLKEKIESGVETYRKETKALETEINSSWTSASAPQGDANKLARLKEQLAAHKTKVTDFVDQTQRDIDNLPSLLASIEKRVSTAETTIDLMSNASFKLKEDEALIIALKAKDMDKKIEGFLTFTNQRMMYESMTTKKTERQLLLERPVSSVAKITKGKVGMFEPEGLIVEFKQPGLPKLKLAFSVTIALKSLGQGPAESVRAATNLHAEYADLVVQYFCMIASGEIDDELKQGVSVAVRKRFKELADSYFPGDSFCFGRCKECGTVVSTPIKKYTMDGWLKMGLFDCPKCHKPFREVLAHEKDDISAKG